MTEATRNQTSLSRGREIFNRNEAERPVKGFPLGRAYKYNFLFRSKSLILKNVRWHLIFLLLTIVNNLSYVSYL